MNLKEQMAANRLDKQKKQQNRANKKQVVPNQPLLRAMDNLSRKLIDNTLCMPDTHNLLLMYQHTFFIQSMAEDASFNWVGIKYLNKIKQTFDDILLRIINNNCFLVNGAYHAKESDKIVIYKQTRYKLLWFISQIYDKTAQLLNYAYVNHGWKQKVAKHQAYAKKHFDFRLKLTDSPVAKFLYQ